jgi:hypothetical protein
VEIHFQGKEVEVKLQPSNGSTVDMMKGRYTELVDEGELY